jgi:hypothetical protein
MLLTEAARFGDWLRNDLSAMELELARRRRAMLDSPVEAASPPGDEKLCRWSLRLVCTSPTETGVVAWARRAAAAAAAESAALEARLARNAWAAAVAAEGLGSGLRCCIECA